MVASLSLKAPPSIILLYAVKVLSESLDIHLYLAIAYSFFDSLVIEFHLYYATEIALINVTSCVLSHFSHV